MLPLPAEFEGELIARGRAAEATKFAKDTLVELDSAKSSTTLEALEKEVETIEGLAAQSDDASKA